MLRGLLTVVLLVVALPALGEERSSRARVSANGLFSVRLVVSKPGSCALEVSKESGPVWKLSSCVGAVDDLYYVSDDGERVWMLKTLVEKAPESAASKARKKKGPPAWANVVVAVEYGRKGAVKEVRLPELMGVKEMGELRELKGHFKWLEGTLSVPGKSPRLTDAGIVEFESVGGKTHQLKF